MANNNKCSDKIIDGRKSDITKDLIIWSIQTKMPTQDSSRWKKNERSKCALNPNAILKQNNPLKLFISLSRSFDFGSADNNRVCIEAISDG